MFKHVQVIPYGIKGEISKIIEEIEELKDTYDQKHGLHSLIECSDIIEAVSQFSFKKYGIPLIILLILVYVRKLYKPIRNIIRDILGKPKFLPQKESNGISFN